MSGENEEYEVKPMNNQNNNKPGIKRALTISLAAEYACVSRGTIENWMAKRILPFEDRQ